MRTSFVVPSATAALFPLVIIGKQVSLESSSATTLVPLFVAPFAAAALLPLNLTDVRVAVQRSFVFLPGGGCLTFLEAD